MPKSTLEERRGKLLAAIDAAWKDFEESYAGLSDESLVESGVVENWSIKDIIAHVTIWDEEAIKHLPLVMQGGRPPRYSVAYGGINVFNAQMVERRRAHSLADTFEQQDASHQQLIGLIEQIPPEHFASESRVRRRIRLDTYSHYPIHAQAIREWRLQRNAS